ESVRKKMPQRGARKLGGWGGAVCFCELLKKGLPRWCWAGSIPPFDDSLLQYILDLETKMQTRVDFASP
ncbi:unnamed protein product, partial [Symbiodinium sp. KB8]